MPAIPIIIAVAVDYGVAAIAADIAAEMAISTLVADIATGAIAGAAAGAASSAVSGGNVGKGALKGAAGGAVGGGLFGSAASGGGVVPNADTGSQTLNAGIRGAEKSSTSALVQGKGIKGAAEQGLVGGAVGAIGNSLSPQTGNQTTDNLVSGVGKGIVGSELSGLFSPQQSSQTSGPSASPGPDVSAPTVGSSALGQALGTQGPSLTALFGGSQEKENQKPVWNTASLRNKDETGSSNG